MITKKHWMTGAVLTLLTLGPGAAAEEIDTDVLDLGTLFLNTERWSYEQEMSARIIRTAWNVPHSEDPADRDQLRCWIENRPLSRFGYLYCARMGDITARMPREIIFNRYGLRAEGYGTFLQSTQPVNPDVFEKILFQLTGNEQFNEEFVELVEEGERPPRYFPSQEEINQYLLVAESLKTLGDDPPRDAANELAKAHGLTLGRFEEIKEMIQLFPSVSDAVASRRPSQGYRLDILSEAERLVLANSD